MKLCFFFQILPTLSTACLFYFLFFVSIFKAYLMSSLKYWMNADKLMRGGGMNIFGDENAPFLS